MLNFIVASPNDLTKERCETIYKWRFVDYMNCFESYSKPSLNQHEKFIRNELTNPDVKWFFAILDGKFSACCSFSKKTSPNTKLQNQFTLGRVMVDPNMKRLKLASQMINYGSEYARRQLDAKLINLVVLKSNNAAINLYTQCGFKRTDEDRGRIIMEKSYE